MSRDVGPSKSDVYAAIRSVVSERLQVLEAMTVAARDEATSAESRPENKYDTRAVEASYLAAGQGARLADLRRLHAWSSSLQVSVQDQVGVGALVHVEVDGRRRWLVLAPMAGPAVTVSGVEVALISTSAPLGRALTGAEVDDAVEVEGPRGVYEAEVLSVA